MKSVGKGAVGTPTAPVKTTELPAVPPSATSPARSLPPSAVPSEVLAVPPPATSPAPSLPPSVVPSGMARVTSPAASNPAVTTAAVAVGSPGAALSANALEPPSPHSDKKQASSTAASPDASGVSPVSTESSQDSPVPVLLPSQQPPVLSATRERIVVGIISLLLALISASLFFILFKLIHEDVTGDDTAQVGKGVAPDAAPGRKTTALSVGICPSFGPIADLEIPVGGRIRARSPGTPPVKLACKTGYVLSGLVGSTLICMAGNPPMWSTNPNKIACTALLCPAAGPIPNLEAPAGGLIPATSYTAPPLTLACHRGFELMGLPGSMLACIVGNPPRWTVDPRTIHCSELPARLLVCIASAYKESTHPPDGLCDLFACVADSSAFDLPRNQAMNDYLSYASSSKSLLGFFFQRLTTKLLATLKAKDGENAFRSVWNENVKHYGIRGTYLAVDTQQVYIDKLVDFLVTLKSLQTKMQGGRNHERLYLFLGMSPLYKGNEDTQGVMKAYFDNLIKRAKPNLVLFETTDSTNFRANEAGCLSNGGSLWQNAPRIYQSTFEDSLKFRNSITLPRSTGELLSISLCGYIAKFSVKVRTVSIGEGNGCTGAFGTNANDYVCPKGKFYGRLDHNYIMDPDRLVYIAVGKYRSYIITFEKKQSIWKKMCKASVEYQYKGGWAIYIECNDKTNRCEDSTFTNGSARLHWMKQYMDESFTAC